MRRARYRAVLNGRREKKRAANEEVAKMTDFFASPEECMDSPFDTLLSSLHTLDFRSFSAPESTVATLLFETLRFLMLRSFVIEIIESE